MTTQPFRQIVVPVDFSPHSGAAVQWAALCEARTGATVRVLHTEQFEAPPTFTLEQVQELAREAGRTREELREEASAFVTRHAGREVAWEIHVEEGDPVRRMLDHCAGADLVIMGTHGRRGARRWMLGSVAEAMVQANRLPVLVAHLPVEALAVRRILLATGTGRAADTARALAEACGAELVVPAVGEHKHPAEAILQAAQDQVADLVVLGAARRRFLGMDILPDTVTNVLRYGTTATLVVPDADGGVLR